MRNGDSEHKTPRAKALARAGRGTPRGSSSATFMRYACVCGGATVLFLSGIIAGALFFSPSVPTAGPPGLVGNLPGAGSASSIRGGGIPAEQTSSGDGLSSPGQSQPDEVAIPSHVPIVPAPKQQKPVDHDGQTQPLPPQQQQQPPQQQQQQQQPADLHPQPPTDAWATFGGSSSVLIMASGPDSPSMTLAAWVYLASAPADMSVIASTRAGGCAASASTNGFNFHINEWGTNNRKLRLEWTDQSSGNGCQSLATEAGAVPVGRWTHVAFAFGPDGSLGGAAGAGETAALYIDGRLSASMAGVRRTPQSTGAGVIGATTDLQFGFNGRIADILALSMPATEAQLQHIVAAGPAARFRAVVKQADAHSKVTAAFLLFGASSKGAAGGRDDQSSVEFEVLAGAAKLSKRASAHPVPEGANDPGAEPAPGLPDDIPPPPPRAERVAVEPDRFDTGGNQWVSRLVKLDPSLVKGTVNDADALADGSFSDDISKEDMLKSDEVGKGRADQIKAGMEFVWGEYRSKAWGADELRPRSGTSQNNWGGMAFTMIDALDTLWVMGMHDEFNEATEYIRDHVHFGVPRTVSVFETTIRGLGGLLSAYDLSGERMYLEKAKDLGDRLAKSFATPSGVPMGQINLQSGQGHNSGWTGSASILAEVGTVQVEHRYLSHATGIPYYGRKAENAIHALRKHPQPHGLYPIYISPQTGQPTNRQITFGALGDSFYEYLVKVWVQGGSPNKGGDRVFRDMYDEAMQGLHDVLLQRSSPSRLQYVADFNGAQPVHKMDHLVCFVPGMLALGAWTADGTGGAPHVQRDLQAAKAIAYTCYQMYARQATGIAPEYVDFREGADIVVPSRAPFYILRPEAAESLYVLHQLTGNPIYREWGWKMWQSIDRYCKTKHGYGAYPDVRDVSRPADDRMESFFLAETMKYLYMLQSPDHPISLERYVFNTEAHPMRRFDHWGSNSNVEDWGFAAKVAQAASKPAPKAGLRGAGKPQPPGMAGAAPNVGSDPF